MTPRLTPAQERALRAVAAEREEVCWSHGARKSTLRSLNRLGLVTLKSSGVYSYSRSRRDASCAIARGCLVHYTHDLGASIADAGRAWLAVVAQGSIRDQGP